MIKFESVSLSYDCVLFDKLNFIVEKGDHFAITGESGAGKTSILNIILGFTKPDEGIVINDFKKISTVFQSDLLIDNLSAIDNIKIATNREENYIKEWLNNFSIEYTEKDVSKYSGGMRRRVSILRALMHDDFDLLILDEPIRGLDKNQRDKIISYILSVLKDKTLILVTHNEEDIKDFKINKILKI